MKVNLTRRELLRMGAIGMAALPFSGLTAACQTGAKILPKPDGAPYQGSDEQLLDEIEKASFEFFWNEAGAKSGQVRDRANATTPLKPKEGLNGAPASAPESSHDHYRMSSIAATGFGLSALGNGGAAWVSVVEGDHRTGSQHLAIHRERFAARARVLLSLCGH